MMGLGEMKADRRRTGSLRVKWIACVVVMIGFLRMPGPPLLRGDIYWFEDENGVLHLSNTPVDQRYRFKERERPSDDAGVFHQERRAGYDKLIEKVARSEGLDCDLLRAVVETESNYDSHAISAKGAVGLMQLMPETARRMGVTDPFHPAENLEAGARHLRRLIEKYEGKLALALSAYNAGENAVDRYNGIPPFPETREYVKKVLNAYRGGDRQGSVIRGQGPTPGP